MEDVVRLTRELYDNHAQEYVNTTGTYDNFPGLREEVDRFLAKTRTAGPLLDLGCGVGRDSEYFLSLGRNVVAADLSIEMLRITIHRCSGYSNLKVVQADMANLPVRDNTFAGIWLCASLLHLPLRVMDFALREAIRVLESGGQVAISMKAGEGEGWRTGKSIHGKRWFTFVHPDQFLLQLAAAGFREPKIIPSGRDQWFIAEATKP